MIKKRKISQESNKKQKTTSNEQIKRKKTEHKQSSKVTTKKTQKKEKTDQMESKKTKQTPLFVPKSVIPKVSEAKDLLKIITWNVNGLRAASKKDLWKVVKNENADILCFSEVKAQRDDVVIPSSIMNMGYHVIWNSGKIPGYAGTALFSKIKPIKTDFTIGSSTDNEGRVIIAEYDFFILINTYVPNSGEELKFKAHRINFNTHITKKLVSMKKPVIWTGDLNVAHLDIDVYDGRTNKNREKSAGFTPYERKHFSSVIENSLLDVYRKFYKDTVEESWTFWSYRGNMKVKNKGWRLDYFLVSPSIFPSIKSIKCHQILTTSDHCPLILELDTKTKMSSNIDH